MESEVNQYEEPEKPPTKRRSSILKIPKSRNPFEDIDVTETCTDISMFKPVRRVSFASSNFIKPFVADPEKNTIWDTTYEEDVNHTNSTQSSQEQILNSCTKLGSTLFDSGPTSEVAVNCNATVLSEHNMELTNVISFVDKENIPIYSHKKISLVDYIKKQSSNQVVSDPDDNVTEMEFTCQNAVLHVELDLNDTSICEQVDEKKQLDVSEMEVATKTNRVSSILKKPTKNDMSKTTVSQGLCCQIPQTNLTKTEEEMQFTCQIPQNNCTIVNDNVELTCQVPPYGSTIANDMEFTCQPLSNFNERNENLEFTRHVPLGNLIQVDDDVEFTCHAPENSLTTINFKNKAGNVTNASDGMEFTCQVPQGSGNMEFTSHMPENNLTKYDGMEFCRIPLNEIKTNDLELNAKLLPTDLADATLLETSQRKCEKIEIYVEDTNQVSKNMQCSLEPVRDIDKTHNETKSQVPYSKSEKSVLYEKSYSDMEVDETYMSNSSDKNKTKNSNNVSLNISKPYIQVSDKSGTAGHINEQVLAEISSKESQICENKGDVEVMSQTNILSKTQKDVKHPVEPICHVDNIDKITITETSVLKGKSYSDMEVDETSINTNSVAQNLNVTDQNTANCDTNKLNGQVSNILIQKFNTDVKLNDSRTDISKKKLEKCNMENEAICKVDEPLKAVAAVPLLDVSNVEKSKTLELEFKETHLKPTNQTFDAKNTDVGNCHTPRAKSSKISHIPIRTPDRSSAKKSCKSQNHKQQTKLNLNSGSPMTEELKTKMPNLPSFKHELSDVKTPEVSFHINLTNISSGLDDTQHLLQCTYSKPNPVLFLRSRLGDKDDTGFGLNLEETGHVSRPNITGCNFEETINKNSPDTSTFDIPKCMGKLANINDTYVLKNKKGIENIDFEEMPTEINDDLDEDTSLGVLTEDCLQSICHESFDEVQDPKQSKERVDYKVPMQTLKDFKLKEYPDFKIKRIPEISDLQQTVAKQTAHIKNFLENFKCRPMRIPNEFPIFEKSSIDSSASKEISEESIKCPTIEENIRKRQESCLKCWKLETVDEDFYHFSTLFGTLRFVVQLHPESGKVFSVETSNKLATNCKPLARFVMKLFLEKLNDSHVKSAIGDHSDILSLLDYVQMTMLQLQKFQRDFMKCDYLTMEEDFVAKYQILSMPLVLSCDILVDVSDLENLNCDKHIRVVTHIGVANENEIKNLAKNCAKGLDFFTSFHKNLQEYLDVKRKKKRFDGVHM